MEAFLIAGIAALGVLDWAWGALYLDRPIFLCPLVGLVLGDLEAGVMIGATLELFFMGAISIGAYIPPDMIVGSVLAAAFAISFNQSTEIAVALAMPIALISLAINNVLAALFPLIMHELADKGAREGNAKKITVAHWTIGGLKALYRFLLVLAVYYFGVENLGSYVDAIPEIFTNGMSVAAGLLPAMGLAMLLKMIVTKENIPFYFLGFILAAYLSMPIVGLSLLGIIIVLIKFNFLSPETNVNSAGGNDDDDF